MTRLVLAAFALVACSSRSTPAPPDPEPTKRTPLADEVLKAARSSLDTPPPSGAKRWLAGDVHMHVSPPDDPGDVTLSVAEIAAEAVASQMSFVVLTPHAHPGPGWSTAAGRRATKARWAQLAAEARTLSGRHGIALIPGVEWSTREGHFTVTGADLTRIDDADFLRGARAAGAFISVNHPFAVPTNIPGIRISDFDISYRVWSAGAPGFTAIDGVEVWNVPLGLANIISRPGGRTGEERAWTEANRVVHKERRRMVAVGGTDNHRTNVSATTWVLAESATPESVLAALRAGATCIGGPEAGSLRATGDGNTTARIGESVRVTGDVELAWDGRARLFIDDVDRGEHDRGFTHASDGKLHTYRIVVGTSRCGFVYANL